MWIGTSCSPPMRTLHRFASIILASFTTVCVAQDTKLTSVPSTTPQPAPARQPGTAADDARSPRERQTLDQYARIARVTDPQIRVALALRVALAADKHLTSAPAPDALVSDATARAVSSIDSRGLPPEIHEAWSVVLKERDRVMTARQRFLDSLSPETEKEYNDTVIDRKAATDKLLALLPDVLAPTFTASATDLEIRNEVVAWLRQFAQQRKRPIFC